MQINYEKNGFNWDENTQGMVLGSLFWLLWIFQIPGGVMAKKFGSKIVLSTALLIKSMLGCLIPIVAYFDYRLVVLIRIVQGAASVSVASNNLYTIRLKKLLYRE